jgi:predicted DNA-binding transcriptional regulator
VSVINYDVAVIIETVYLAGLGVCLALNRSNRLLQPTLICIVFALFNKFFLYDFLYSSGASIWTMGWVCYLLVMMTLFIQVRRFNKERLYLTDIILLFVCFVNVVVFGLTYVARIVLNQGWMDFVYAMTDPVTNVIFILALVFPSVFKSIRFFKGSSFYDSNSNRSSFSRYFYVRVCRVLGI